jgi:tubulin beta
MKTGAFTKDSPDRVLVSSPTVAPAPPTRPWRPQRGLCDICFRRLRLPTLGDPNHLTLVAWPGRPHTPAPRAAACGLPQARGEDRPLPRAALLRLRFNLARSSGGARRRPPVHAPRFDNQGRMAACRPGWGVCLAAPAHFRGRTSSNKVEEQTSNVQVGNSTLDADPAS